MRTIWQSLAWKEWHEHKWRLAALTLIQCVLGIVAFGNGNGIGQDALGAVLAMAVIAGGPLAIFIGAGDAAGERSRGTMPFLQSLPIPLWRVALFKLVYGLIAVIIPPFCMAGVLFIILWFRDKLGFSQDAISWFVASGVGHWTTGNRLVDTAVIIAALSASLYFWTVAGGARRGDEVSAGAFGLLLIVGWWFLLILVYLVFATMVGKAALPYRPLLTWIATIGIATAPAGFLTAFGERLQLFSVAIAVSLMAHAVIGLTYLVRFHSPPDLGERSPHVAPRVRDQRDWLRPVFGSTWQAIAWKQAREIGPLAILAATGVLAIFSIILATWWFDANRVHRTADDVVRLYGTITFGLGTFVSLVAGIGVAFNDVGSKLGGFWRSRPINPNLWYWTKYATGLLVVFAALYLPLVVVTAVLNDEAFRPAGFSAVWDQEVWVVPAMQFAFFSTALALTCLIRQGIYAAILSIGVTYLTLAPFEVIRLRYTDYSSIPTGLVIADFIVVGIIATIIGWLAMRNDWGRRLL